MLTVLDLTGVPGLTEKSAVEIATSCKALEIFDLSGYWGPMLCVTCVQKIITKCTQLRWIDICPYIPQSPSWVELLAEKGGVENRVVHFGCHVTTLVEAEQESD